MIGGVARVRSARAEARALGRALTRLGIQLHDHQRIVMVAIHEAQNVASQTAILEAIDAAGEDDAAPYLSLVTWEDEA